MIIIGGVQVPGFSETCTRARLAELTGGPWALFDLILDTFPRGTLVEFEQRDGEWFNDFIDAWQAADDITMGEVLGLAELVDQHESAIAYDLLERGLRLRDLPSERLTWADLRTIVTHLPRGSALHRERAGEDSEWGLAEQLLAAIADALNGANWQRAGSKGRAPKPIDRPGVRPESKTYGKGGVPASDMYARLGWDAPAGN